MTDRRGIRFYRSSDFDALTEAWVNNYQESFEKRDPFIPEVVIVHSHAMARHLNRVLTRQLRVTALIEYLLPSAWENRIRKSFLTTGDSTDDTPMSAKTESPLDKIRYSENPYDPNYLQWILYYLLTQPKHREILKNIPVLKNYLFTQAQEKVSSSKAYHLAKIMATTFNDYLFFREEMMWEWDSAWDSPIGGEALKSLEGLGELEKFDSRGQSWQKWLWQALRQSLSYPHRLEELAQIKEILRGIRPKGAELPSPLTERISVFGISYLPPYYLELFHNLKNLIAIDYYYPDTTRPWGGALIERPALLEKLCELPDTYLEQINRLDWERIDLPPKTTTGRGGVLSFIKSFFSEKDSLTETETSPPAPKNLQGLLLHRCPNCRREVEVVKSQILSLLEGDPHLTLDKILIMAPDILAYRDYLESVFTAEPALPYHIIDRNDSHNNSIIKAMMAILDLFNSDWEISRVREILSLDVVRLSQAWGLEEILELEGWIEHLGIKRGRGNAPHPDLEKYGWREGIRRIMFHFALPVSATSDTSEKLKKNLHGDDAQNLGKMVYLLQKLLDLDRQFHQPTNFTGWLGRLLDLIQTLYLQEREYLYPPEMQKDHVRLQRQIRNLGERVSLADSLLNTGLNQDGPQAGDEVDIQTFMEILKQNLQEVEHVREGSHIGITCGSLLPLRVIPVEITFMIGMGRDQFPRHDRQSHFNLILQNPRPSDRTIKKSDHLLMIETLFATRRHLGITFSPDPKDEITSPSTLVDELISVLSSRSGVNMRESIIIDHPLLPSLAEPSSDSSLNSSNPLNFKQSLSHELPPHGYYSYDPEDYRSAIARDKRKRLSPSPREDTLLTTLTVVESINPILQELILPFSRNKGASEKVAEKNYSNNPLSFSFLTGWERDSSQETQENNPSKTIVINWEQVKSFLTDAPKFFLRQTLGINLDVISGDEDGETFTLTGLGRYQAVENILQNSNWLYKDKGGGSPIPNSVISDDPDYPPGSPGYNQVELLKQNLHRLQKNLVTLCDKIQGRPEEFFSSDNPLIVESLISSDFLSDIFSGSKGEVHPDLKIEGVITGTQMITGILHRVACHHLRITVNDVLRNWLDHLLLHTVNSQVATWLVGEETLFFPPLKGLDGLTTQEKNRFIRKKIIAYVVAFTTRQHHPLPIYKKLSETFHEERMKGVPFVDVGSMGAMEEMLGEIKSPIDPVTKDNKKDGGDKGVFTNEALYPSPDYPYAYYLWGSEDRYSIPPEAIKGFSELYHLLWDDLYHHLRRWQP